ncbi:MAG: hypothetical protein C5B60_10165 [Chloroflexi bacterium]|nr:MAG: hypothetical protein C5B60_10165 [Chloroflexota bacterium]
MLVIVLSLLGGLGAGSYILLEQATRTPTVTDIAQGVCNAYTTQNYQLLINQIEPGPITGGSSLPNGFNLSGPFDSNAKSQLTSALQTLDRNYGRVTSCQQRQLRYQGAAVNTGRAQFIFVMHRSGTPDVVYSCLMNFTQASGTWLITRDSNFIGTPT